MGNGHCKDFALPGERFSWVAVGVGVGGAVIGAAGNYMGAKESNKPRNAKTDQTTSQNPWLSDWYDEDINNVLQYQRGIVARGVPQLGANGQVTYQNQLPWGHEGGNAQFAAGGGGGGNGGPAVPAGGSRRPDGRILDASGKTIYTPPAGGGGKAGGGGGGKNKGGGGATKAGPSSVSPSINYQDPKDVFGAVAQRGLAAGNSGTQTQARNAIGNILGAAGTAGGSGAAGEQTGYEGYNPILDRLTGRLEGNADRANARDLIMGFLGETGRAGGATTSAKGTRQPTQYTANGTPVASGGSFGGGYATSGPGGVTPPPTNANGVPDTMAVSSYFGDQTRKIMDEEANTAELEALIKSMNEDTEKGMYRDLAQLDAAAQGSGRFGGDMWKGMSADAREEALQEMTKTASGVRMSDREARRQARLAALQGVNQRDLGLLGANVQREGIAAGERSASGAQGAASAAAADQLALARRGQDLQAISQLMGNEEFNLGQLAGVGGQLSSDRMGALGLVPGLEGIGLQGLQTALGAGGGLTDLRGQNIQQSIANQGNRLAQQGMNQQAAMWNAGQQQQLVNNYLGTLQNIGSMGGSSRTVGNNVIPGAGVSPSGAALTGAAGGAAAGIGIYGQMRYGY